MCERERERESDGGSVCERRGEGGRMLRDWGSCTVSPEGGRRPLDNNSCPHSDGTKQKKRAPSVPHASGPPSLLRGECTSPLSAPLNPRLPSSSPLPACLPACLTDCLPGAVCSARQNNGKQGPDPRPKPPWTNCFHLRPTFLDDALTNGVGIKPSANNEVK